MSEPTVQQHHVNPKIAYLLSFLAILVAREGWKMIIPNLSEYAGKDIALAMEIDTELDQVTLTVQE